MNLTCLIFLYDVWIHVSSDTSKISCKKYSFIFFCPINIYSVCVYKESLLYKYRLLEIFRFPFLSLRVSSLKTKMAEGNDLIRFSANLLSWYLSNALMLQ